MVKIDFKSKIWLIYCWFRLWFRAIKMCGFEHKSWRIYMKLLLLSVTFISCLLGCRLTVGVCWDVVFIFCRVKALIPSRPPPQAGPSRAERVKTNTNKGLIAQLRRAAYSINSIDWCVLLQAVLDFHRQVGNTVAVVSEQYEELFGASCKMPQDHSQEQMLIQLMGALNVSGRYFTFKEQIKVRAKIPEMICYCKSVAN